MIFFLVLIIPTLIILFNAFPTLISTEALKASTLRQNQNKSRNFRRKECPLPPQNSLLITTLDGNLSLIDSISGNTLWVIDTGGPLISTQQHGTSPISPSDFYSNHHANFPSSPFLSKPSSRSSQQPVMIDLDGKVYLNGNVINIPTTGLDPFHPDHNNQKSYKDKETNSEPNSPSFIQFDLSLEDIVTFSPLELSDEAQPPMSNILLGSKSSVKSSFDLIGADYPANLLRQLNDHRQIGNQHNQHHHEQKHSHLVNNKPQAVPTHCISLSLLKTRYDLTLISTPSSPSSHPLPFDDEGASEGLHDSSSFDNGIDYPLNSHLNIHNKSSNNPNSSGGDGYHALNSNHLDININSEISISKNDPQHPGSHDLIRHQKEQPHDYNDHHDDDHHQDQSAPRSSKDQISYTKIYPSLYTNLPININPIVASYLGITNDDNSLKPPVCYSIDPTFHRITAQASPSPITHKRPPIVPLVWSNTQLSPVVSAYRIEYIPLGGQQASPPEGSLVATHRTSNYQVKLFKIIEHGAVLPTMVTSPPSPSPQDANPHHPLSRDQIDTSGMPISPIDAKDDNTLHTPSFSFKTVPQPPHPHGQSEQCTPVFRNFPRSYNSTHPVIQYPPPGNPMVTPSGFGICLLNGQFSDSLRSFSRQHSSPKDNSLHRQISTGILTRDQHLQCLYDLVGRANALYNVIIHTIRHPNLIYPETLLGVQKAHKDNNNDGGNDDTGGNDGLYGDDSRSYFNRFDVDSGAPIPTFVNLPPPLTRSDLKSIQRHRTLGQMKLFWLKDPNPNLKPLDPIITINPYLPVHDQFMQCFHPTDRTPIGFLLHFNVMSSDNGDRSFDGQIMSTCTVLNYAISNHYLWHDRELLWSKVVKRVQQTTHHPLNIATAPSKECVARSITTVPPSQAIISTIVKTPIDNLGDELVQHGRKNHRSHFHPVKSLLAPFSPHNPLDKSTMVSPVNDDDDTTSTDSNSDIRTDHHPTNPLNYNNIKHSSHPHRPPHRVDNPGQRERHLQMGDNGLVTVDFQTLFELLESYSSYKFNLQRSEGMKSFIRLYHQRYGNKGDVDIKENSLAPWKPISTSTTVNRPLSLSYDDVYDLDRIDPDRPGSISLAHLVPNPDDYNDYHISGNSHREDDHIPIIEHDGYIDHLDPNHKHNHHHSSHNSFKAINLFPDHFPFTITQDGKFVPHTTGAIGSDLLPNFPIDLLDLLVDLSHLFPANGNNNDNTNIRNGNHHHSNNFFLPTADIPHALNDQNTHNNLNTKYNHYYRLTTTATNTASTATNNDRTDGNVRIDTIATFSPKAPSISSIHDDFAIQITALVAHIIVIILHLASVLGPLVTISTILLIVSGYRCKTRLKQFNDYHRQVCLFNKISIPMGLLTDAELTFKRQFTSFASSPEYLQYQRYLSQQHQTNALSHPPFGSPYSTPFTNPQSFNAQLPIPSRTHQDDDHLGVVADRLTEVNITEGDQSDKRIMVKNNRNVKRLPKVLLDEDINFTTERFTDDESDGDHDIIPISIIDLDEKSSLNIQQIFPTKKIPLSQSSFTPEGVTTTPQVGFKPQTSAFNFNRNNHLNGQGNEHQIVNYSQKKATSLFIAGITVPIYPGRFKLQLSIRDDKQKGLLGAGGFGAVKICKDIVDGAVYAIKQIVMCSPLDTAKQPQSAFTPNNNNNNNNNNNDFIQKHTTHQCVKNTPMERPKGSINLATLLDSDTARLVKSLQSKGAQVFNGELEWELVLREARSLAKLDHQHIVRYYNCWLEYLHGEDDVWLDSGRKEVKKNQERLVKQQQIIKERRRLAAEHRYRREKAEAIRQTQALRRTNPMLFSQTINPTLSKPDDHLDHLYHNAIRNHHNPNDIASRASSFEPPAVANLLRRDFQQLSTQSPQQGRVDDGAVVKNKFISQFWGSDDDEDHGDSDEDDLPPRNPPPHNANCTKPVGNQQTHHLPAEISPTKSGATFFSHFFAGPCTSDEGDDEKENESQLVTDVKESKTVPLPPKSRDVKSPIFAFLGSGGASSSSDSSTSCSQTDDSDSGGDFCDSDNDNLDQSSRLDIVFYRDHSPKNMPFQTWSDDEDCIEEGNHTDDLDLNSHGSNWDGSMSVRTGDMSFSSFQFDSDDYGSSLDNASIGSMCGLFDGNKDGRADSTGSDSNESDQSDFSYQMREFTQDSIFDYQPHYDPQHNALTFLKNTSRGIDMITPVVLEKQSSKQLGCADGNAVSQHSSPLEHHHAPDPLSYSVVEYCRSMPQNCSSVTSGDGDHNIKYSSDTPHSAASASLQTISSITHHNQAICDVYCTTTEGQSQLQGQYHQTTNNYRSDISLHDLIPLHTSENILETHPNQLLQSSPTITLNNDPPTSFLTSPINTNTHRTIDMVIPTVNTIITQDELNNKNHTFPNTTNRDFDALSGYSTNIGPISVNPGSALEHYIFTRLEQTNMGQKTPVRGHTRLHINTNIGINVTNKANLRNNVNLNSTITGPDKRLSESALASLTPLNTPSKEKKLLPPLDSANSNDDYNKDYSVCTPTAQIRELHQEKQIDLKNPHGLTGHSGQLFPHHRFDTLFGQDGAVRMNGIETLHHFNKRDGVHPFSQPRNHGMNKNSNPTNHSSPSSSQNNQSNLLHQQQCSIVEGEPVIDMKVNENDDIIEFDTSHYTTNTVTRTSVNDPGDHCQSRSPIFKVRTDFYHPQKHQDLKYPEHQPHQVNKSLFYNIPRPENNISSIETLDPFWLDHDVILTANERRKHGGEKCGDNGWNNPFIDGHHHHQAHDDERSISGQVQVGNILTLDMIRTTVKSRLHTNLENIHKNPVDQGLVGNPDNKTKSFSNDSVSGGNINRSNPNLPTPSIDLNLEATGTSIHTSSLVDDRCDDIILNTNHHGVRVDGDNHPPFFLITPLFLTAKECSDLSQVSNQNCNQQGPQQLDHVDNPNGSYRLNAKGSLQQPPPSSPMQKPTSSSHLLPSPQTTTTTRNHLNPLYPSPLPGGHSHQQSFTLPPLSLRSESRHSFQVSSTNTNDNFFLPGLQARGRSPLLVPTQQVPSNTPEQEHHSTLGHTNEMKKFLQSVLQSTSLSQSSSPLQQPSSDHQENTPPIQLLSSDRSPHGIYNSSAILTSPPQACSATIMTPMTAYRGSNLEFVGESSLDPEALSPFYNSSLLLSAETQGSLQEVNANYRFNAGKPSHDDHTMVTRLDGKLNNQLDLVQTPPVKPTTLRQHVTTLVTPIPRGRNKKTNGQTPLLSPALPRENVSDAAALLGPRSSHKKRGRVRANPSLPPSPAPQQTPQGLIFYLQMQYCQYGTLRTYLDSRTSIKVVECFVLFEMLLLGVHHIHSQRLIHRDLKPDNIFFDEPLHIRIGDFGLCTSPDNYEMGNSNSNPNHLNKQTSLNALVEHGPLSAHDSKVSGDIERIYSPMTGGVGSYLYAAPEQIKGGNPLYSNKCDMFSIGIILFELFSLFSSASYRIHSIYKARAGHVEIAPVDVLWFDVEDLTSEYMKRGDGINIPPHLLEQYNQWKSDNITWKHDQMIKLQMDESQRLDVHRIINTNQSQQCPPSHHQLSPNNHSNTSFNHLLPNYHREFSPQPSSSSSSITTPLFTLQNDNNIMANNLGGSPGNTTSTISSVKQPHSNQNGNYQPEESTSPSLHPLPPQTPPPSFLPPHDSTNLFSHQSFTTSSTPQPYGVYGSLKTNDGEELSEMERRGLWFMVAQEREEIQQVITNLLSPDPTIRLSCEDILKTRWFRKQQLRAFNHGNFLK